MRKLFLQIGMTLDGYIEDPAGTIDWHFVDDEFEEYINETLRSIDAMVFGRVAYEQLAEYWPTAASLPDVSERHVEAAGMMNELPKYVVSNSLQGTEWENSHILSGDVADEVTKLKGQPGADIPLFAGARVASSFAGLGLIDEYRLIVNPVLLGAGKPLFQGGYHHTNLRLRKTRQFESGALVLTYEVDTAS